MDRDALLAHRLITDRVEIPGVGPVVVRGLSRGEVFDLRGRKLDAGELEVATIALCMVDPALSPDDVRAWMRNAHSTEHELVFAKIRELSGLNEGAQKSNGTGPDAG